MVAGLIAIMCANRMYYSSQSNNSDGDKCDDCMNLDDCTFEDIYDEDAHERCGNYKSYDDLEDE